MEARYGKRSAEERHGEAPRAKMAELIATKEELKMARDSVRQSWLDSKPLMDELEKLQSGLESAKNLSSKSHAVISQLRLSLQTIGKEIRSKKEEEFQATQMINEVSRVLDQKQEELETLAVEADEEQTARLKSKQVLRMRRQSLRALQLRLRAIRIETEAFKESAAKATHRIISNSDMKDATVKLTQEEYYHIRERAKEEELLAEWRISVSTEQRLATEASVNLALKRSIELFSNGISRSRRNKKGNAIEDGDGVKKGKEEDSSCVRARTEDNNGRVGLAKAQANIIAAAAEGNAR